MVRCLFVCLVLQRVAAGCTQSVGSTCAVGNPRKIVRRPDRQQSVLLQAVVARLARADAPLDPETDDGLPEVQPSEPLNTTGTQPGLIDIMAGFGNDAMFEGTLEEVQNSASRLVSIGEELADTNGSHNMVKWLAEDSSVFVVEVIFANTTLKELHNKWDGSLTDFLVDLRETLSKAAGADQMQMFILDIYQEMNFSSSPGVPTRYRNSELSHAEITDDIDLGETVVILQLNQGPRAAPSPVTMFSRLLEKYSSGAPGDESLSRNDTIARARIEPGSVPSQESTETLARGALRLSSVALIIWIAAALSAVLIWLSVW